MKFIKNEQSQLTKLIQLENGKRVVEKMTYGEIMIMILESGRELLASEMRKRFKIADVIEPQLKDDYIKLEDAQWDELKKIESTYKWNTSDRGVVKFEDAILSPLLELPQEEKVDVPI